MRYHAVFAANARGRAALAGRRGRSHSPPTSEPPTALGAEPGVVPDPPPDPPSFPHRPRRLSWADLLRRVHRVDVLVCRKCRGRLRVLAFLIDPDVTTAILDHLGLPSTPPPITPARSPPRAELLFPDWPADDCADPAIE